MAGNGRISALTARQAATVAAMLAHPTVEAAAAAVGVSARSVRRWMTDPDFVAALNASKAEAVRHAARRLAGALADAVGTVIHLAQASEDDAIRLRAALAVADLLVELETVGDWSERLAAIERRMQ